MTRPSIARDRPNGDATPLLEIRNLSKSYGAVKALQDVSFEVYPGEIVGLVGDNGAGKSTTVKTISGLLTPDEGTITFNGKEREWTSPREARECGIETLYQEMGLAPHLTVAGNVFLGKERRRRGILGQLGFMDNPAMQRDAKASIDRLKVRVDAGDYRVELLSGGQRQAVALAKALTWAQRLLLLDEPTNHLGVRGTEQLLGVLRGVKETGVSIVFISHTIPHVLAICDRILVLWQGHLVETLTSEAASVDSIVRAITGSTVAAARVET